MGLLGWLRVLISIHALLAESDPSVLHNFRPLQISIHALLAESDHSVRPETRRRDAISIHALLAESDIRYPVNFHPETGFLSTLSLRRATTTLTLTAFTVPHFYPRSPCGERLTQKRHIQKRPKFLSTLSLRRATSRLYLTSLKGNNFYPRSPCGERLRVLDGSKSSIEISIHALLAESDMAIIRKLKLSAYFYPRSPCGERQWRHPLLQRTKIFLSTLSLRRATINVVRYIQMFNISIHALLAESDNIRQIQKIENEISIHALLAESDPMSSALACVIIVFLSTLSLRRATLFSCFIIVYVKISIHALLAESDSKSAQNSGALLRI